MSQPHVLETEDLQTYVRSGILAHSMSSDTGNFSIVAASHASKGLIATFSTLYIRHILSTIAW
jgi:hypothetical protein